MKGAFLIPADYGEGDRNEMTFTSNSINEGMPCFHLRAAMTDSAASISIPPARSREGASLGANAWGGPEELLVGLLYVLPRGFVCDGKTS